MVNTVVHEEILGVNWTPPSNPGMKKTNLPSFKTAKGVVKSMHKSKGTMIWNSHPYLTLLFYGILNY